MGIYCIMKKNTIPTCNGKWGGVSDTHLHVNHTNNVQIHFLNEK